MRVRHDTTGSLLLEVVLASAFVLLLFSALATLAITSHEGTSKALKAQEARWRALEGIEALRTVAFDTLSAVDPGIMSWNGASWSISAGGPETLPGGLTRTMRVSVVERDAQCIIVPAGSGTPDTDSWDIESAVAWTDASGRPQSLELSTLRTRYNAPLGDCFLGAQQADNIVIDTSDAEWSGGKQLREVDIENTSATPVIVDRITYTWTNASTIQQIHIEGNMIWSGNATTGTNLDVTDYTLNALTQYEMDKTQFRDNMTGTTLTLTLTFGDGSSVTTPPFVPN